MKKLNEDWNLGEKRNLGEERSLGGEASFKRKLKQILWLSRFFYFDLGL